MGKKGSWIYAVKKALSPQSKDKKEKKTRQSKSISLSKHGSPEPASLPAEIALPAPATPPAEEVKFTEAESEQDKHDCSIALASAAAEEAAAQAAAEEVVQQTNVARYSGKTKEEVAAIKIQTAFRGYLARMALRALKGLVRLKSLTQGQFIKRQATNTLRCMQTLVRVQSQVRARRIRMSEENQTLQRQLQHKREIELEKSGTSVGENWNHSAQSKEQIEAKLQSKHEAATRRERALAYAYSHQKTLKNSSKPVNVANPTFMDPINPVWGWNWLDRWMAARPWENRELNSDNASVKSAAARAIFVSELNKAHHSPHDLSLNSKKSSPTAQKVNHHHLPSRKPLTPPSKAPPPPMAIKTRPTNPRLNGHGGRNDEHPRSKLGNSQTKHFRRHSVAVSSSRDNKSVEENEPTVAMPSFTTGTTKSANAATKSAKVNKSTLPRTPEKGSVRTAKKQLSFPSSVAETRRHSGPSKIVSNDL